MRPPAGALLLLLVLVLGALRSGTAQVGFVEAPGGRLHYEEAGQGTSVVMIHGGFLDARMWDPQFQVVARHYRAIRYDVRAHGQSISDSVPFADHDDLLALLDSLDVERVVVVGLSLGGQIAIDFALLHPDRVAGLVLVSPGLSGFQFGGDEMARYVGELSPALESGDFGRVTEVFAHWWCDGPHRQPADVDPAVRARVLEMLAGSGQRWRYWNLRRGIDPPAAERLGAIRAPTLAVEGSLDMMVIHEIVDLIAARVPGARRVVIPDVAHMVSMEKPEAFNAVLLRFLEEVVPRPAPGGGGA